MSKWFFKGIPDKADGTLVEKDGIECNLVSFHYLQYARRDTFQFNFLLLVHLAIKIVQVTMLFPWHMLQPQQVHI